MGESVRILLLEDNLQDEELLRETLASSGLKCECIRVDTEPAFRQALGERFDLILSDYSLPAFDGRKALSIARELRPDIPFMFVSGTIGEDVAIESLLSGAADYVLKHRFGRLVPAVRRVLTDAEERRARLKTEEELHVASTQLRNLFENLDEVFFSLTPEPRSILQVSPACERIYGRTQRECLDDPDFWKNAVHPDDRSVVAEAEAALSEGRSTSNEYRILQVGGAVRWVQVKLKPVSGLDGITRVDAIVSDITERKELEAKFLRTQRLENLGSMAGGIAHDLNNVLAPIIMGLDLLCLREEEPRLQDTLTTMRQCAMRGANLVKQILMFARGVQGQRVQVGLAHQIGELEQMLRTAFPKSIRVVIDVASDLREISADPTQLQQVLMNLCVNARDAMPSGGDLWITARNEPTFEGDTPRIGIEVRDTGQGISPEQQEKIFEPFFTTKAVGSGTGLGLSTVQAIVHSHGGTISVRSKVGVGTTFKLLLPALQAAAQPREATAAWDVPGGRGELVMVVDDETAVQNLVSTILEHYGYRVVTAGNGQDGLAVFAVRGREIRLVLTDSDMPVMNGEEMARILRRMSPGLPILAASGLGRVPFGDATISKPFSTEDLLMTVRELLDRRPEAN